jgi:hypothetical protein
MVGMESVSVDAAEAISGSGGAGDTPALHVARLAGGTAAKGVATRSTDAVADFMITASPPRRSRTS